MSHIASVIGSELRKDGVGLHASISTRE